MPTLKPNKDPKQYDKELAAERLTEYDAGFAAGLLQLRAYIVDFKLKGAHIDVVKEVIYALIWERDPTLTKDEIEKWLSQRSQ